jgi:hypothetical protein
VSPSRYFVAAAAVLLLGAAAMPAGPTAYAVAETSREPYATAVGVWGAFVLLVAITGPIVLTIAGIVALFLSERGER